MDLYVESELIKILVDILPQAILEKYAMVHIIGHIEPSNYPAQTL